MKKLLCTILSLTLLLTGCTIGNGNIRIGAAGIGGMYYTFANTLAGLCTKEDTGFELAFLAQCLDHAAQVFLFCGRHL